MSEAEKFGALTLDTSTIQREGFRFDQGNLKLLRQFRGSPIQLIFSSIVTSEVAAHLEDAIRTLRTTLKGLNRDVERLVPHLRHVTPDDVELDRLDPGDAARARLSEFMAAVEAEVVGSAWADLTDIERRYFETLPPFAGAGNKKHEFPDAIALSAIEGWAKAKGKRVLAVSEDKGWVAFESQHIKVVPNIPTALGILQTDPDHRAYLVVADCLRKLPFPKRYDEAGQFRELLMDALDRTEFSVDTESDIAADPDYPEIKLVSYEIDENFTVVKIEEDEIVASITATINAEVSVNVSFSVHDGIDNDEVPMGSGDFVREVEFLDASLLVTFKGDFTSNEWKVVEVEVSEIANTIDLGYVGPDWLGEPDFEPDPGEP